VEVFHAVLELLFGNCHMMQFHYMDSDMVESDFVGQDFVKWLLHKRVVE
jgi:hypothetical protein